MPMLCTALNRRFDRRALLGNKRRQVCVPLEGLSRVSRVNLGPVRLFISELVMINICATHVA